MQDYLQKRKQRTKVRTAYSNWKDNLAGVAQIFILGTILFNIGIVNVTIRISTSKKLVEVFGKHVENICQKASWKVNALARLLNDMDFPKRRILMNAFFNAHNYCPTI